MRLLLAGILIFIPLIAQAKSLDDEGGSDHDSSALDNRPGVDGSDSLSDTLGLFRNPYSPDSPTNYEPFIGPYLYVQGQREWRLYDPQNRETFTMQDWKPDRFHSGNDRSADGINSMHSFPQHYSMSVDWLRER